MAKSNKIDKLCAALALLGVDKAPPKYDEAMRNDGWISIRDIADMQGKSESNLRKVMKNAVKDGIWESQSAMSDLGNALMWVYRPK
tara:strand:- start:6054 stop:6311 length:258 start_codon:yes stop_codon:yes gene_type:complete